MQRRLFYQISGLILIALGINAMIKANLGLTPYDALNANLTSLLGLGPNKIGLVTLIPGLIMALICYIQERKKDILFSIMLLFILSIFITAWSYVFTFAMPNNWISQLILSIIGLMILALGIALSVKSHLPLAPTDRVLVLLSRKINVGLAKFLLEGLYLVIAIIFGGISGNGIFANIFLFTIVSFILIGPLVNVFTWLLNHEKEQKNATK